VIGPGREAREENEGERRGGEEWRSGGSIYHNVYHDVISEKGRLWSLNLVPMSVRASSAVVGGRFIMKHSMTSPARFMQQHSSLAVSTATGIHLSTASSVPSRITDGQLTAPLPLPTTQHPSFHPAFNAKATSPITTHTQKSGPSPPPAHSSN
jgi:hypothetical protein